MPASCRPLTTDDVPAVERLLADDGGYSQRIQGRRASRADAVDLLLDRPPALAQEAKHVVGMFDGSELLAVADVLRGYPTPSRAYIGLLQVAGRVHGRGFGRTLHHEVLALVRTWPEVTTIRLAVADPNRSQADPFWQRMGYTPTGDTTPWGDTLARSWERRLQT